MISRRSFLRASALAGATVGTCAVKTMTAEETQHDLPSPISSLKSMKDQATPITKEERAQRQEKARRLMRENQIGALILTGGTSLNYFTGIQWWLSERLFAAVFPAKGAAFYICPAFEEGRARQQMANAPDSEHAEIRTWQEDEDPYRLVAQGLQERGAATGTVGIEETVRFVFSSGIGKAASQAKIVSGTPVTAGCRMVKSAHEIALMRLASKATLMVYEAVYRSLREGVTKPEVEGWIDQAYERVGFPGEANVQIGENTAYPHGSTAAQVVHEGSIILIDDGCLVEGYTSDITRSFVFGKPTDKMKKVFDIVHTAQTSALRTARPGVPCQAVDAAARKVIVDAGYGPDYRYFAHRVGHGMGMDGHEWPYLVRGNTMPLAGNMTFSDEPGIYIPGEFGLRLEDDMHIMEDGAELFTPQSPSLEEPFGKA